MLELTLEQISMAQSAVDKTAALKLIADHRSLMVWLPRATSPG